MILIRFFFERGMYFSPSHVVSLYKKIQKNKKKQKKTTTTKEAERRKSKWILSTTTKKPKI